MTQESRNVLRGKIIEKYGTIACFCKDFGLSRNAIYMKMRGETPWSLPEAKKVISMLGMTGDAKLIYKIFFDD